MKLLGPVFLDKAGLSVQDMNQQAVLRTAEALGIQTVYVVCTPEERKKKLSKGMAELL